MNRDLDYSYASLITAKKKYLGKFELNQHMHMVNAMRFGQLEPKETRLKFVKEVYNALSQRKISLATPFLSNLRKGGNIASCFIIAVEDDVNSIFDNVKRVALISKNGGGIGIYLGLLRAKGSDVNGFSNAAGTVVQWIKILNDTLVAVNQGGKRAGAGTIALPIWHNDVLDFLDMQTEHGDPRMKAYDVFPQVTVPDIFMERDRNKGSWVTFCPYEVKKKLGIDVKGLYGPAFTEAYLKIEKAAEDGKIQNTRKFDNARNLMKIIMRTQFETGLPYMAFTDTINEYNPNKGDGYITIEGDNGKTYSFMMTDIVNTKNRGEILAGDLNENDEIILRK
jgi:ribonucleoside-diphosphate reductase alpha chain